MIQIKKSTILVTFICFWAIVFAGCSTITDIAGIKDPEFKVSNVRMANLSFDKADLILDVEVYNPNKVALDFAGFDYNLFINKNSFLKGKQELEQKIMANGKSHFKVPIELDYKNLYDTFNNLTGKDMIDYNVLLGFDFNFPVIGRVAFPINEKGSLPLPKIPVIKFDDFKVDNLSFSGADLNLELVVENPNSFDLIMNNFNYDLNINSKTWAKSTMNKKTKIPKKGKTVIAIPVSLKFSTMGRSVYKSFTSRKPLEYNLTGKMNLDTSLPIMKNLDLPINRKGKINLSR